MYKVKHIPQTQESECGLSCVSMVLNYYGYDIIPREMKEYSEIGRDGLSLNKLGSILKDYSCDVDIYEAGYNRLIDIFHGPLILYWENNHFVVLTSITKNHFFITCLLYTSDAADE